MTAEEAVVEEAVVAEDVVGDEDATIFITTAKAVVKIAEVIPEAAIETTAVKPEATETTLVEPEAAIAKLETITGGKAAVKLTASAVKLAAPACRLCGCSRVC